MKDSGKDAACLQDKPFSTSVYPGANGNMFVSQ